jgi:trans-2,3-dihydro-3-hydroxyanthranilate isomerase
MTTRELPFAGHPSLGTAVAVARAREETQARYVQETGAGLQPVEVRIDGRVAHAAMLQEPAAFGDELPTEQVMAALGLSAADADPRLAPQAVSTGIAHIMAPVRDTAVLAEIRPDRVALAELLEANDSIVVYAAACAPESRTARARSFYAELGGAIDEDPATGSAAGPLLAYLHARVGIDELRVEQGIEMGRPSELDVTVEGDRVRVGGQVVVLADGVVDLG